MRKKLFFKSVFYKQVIFMEKKVVLGAGEGVAKINKIK